MKLLTKDSDYAVRALCALAGDSDRLLSVREIAAAQGIPYQYLRKIIQKLIQAGFLTAKEGGSGGVMLAADPVKMKVVDIIRVMQGEVQVSDCLFKKKVCANRNECVLRRNLLRIEKLVEKEFGKITIAGLIKG
ncbi:MAG: Rrf2 family transcriptional regulator [Candidatus Omnitrophica bacterium]|nr:Rrf2 family transcriptional regulator [Candidatus Omnitrophota bacterium]